MIRRLWVGLLVVGVAAVVAGLAGRPASAASAAGGYDFTVVAKLGDPAPGGGQYVGDLEPQAINGSGATLFVSDLAGGEGVFLNRGGVTNALARGGDPAPGWNGWS
jgi:hypothetical protein